ncbi:ankyrin repeat-containing domain protein [Triangularia setosa]|uniref:Ankyrin repeat-containing domain protein n=1 Tax=Triangularia setosa TaxID=2587417 RepID=A0AAN6W0I7_9PEZI|nr:ankyrin repeat-containing domain protein [Podospora setosa]
MHRVLEWVLGKNRDISLIEQAIEDENLEILSQLLSCIPGVDYQSALIKACARDISFVELLLEHGGNAVLVQQSLEARSTLLKIAVENDQVATVKLLLEKGAIVNATSSRGATPLHIAIGENLSHLVTILLNAGADPNIQHDEGAAPLIYATAKGHVQVVKILINHGACVDTCCEDKMLIMGTKASLNPKFDWEQNTLLHSAARDGHEHLVELLVQRGVDMESRNMFNQAPLSLAAEQGQVATSQLLLTHGADIESTVELGYTPLFWASYSGQVEVVRTLLRAGANIEAKSFNGRTALHKAAQSGQAAVVKVLLENGADIEATDSQYYRTPLDWAASKGYSDIVQLLLRQSYRKDCYTPLRHQSLLNPVLSRDSHYQSQ